MSEPNKPQEPKIACLPNGPYYYFTDFTSRTVDKLQSSKGEERACVRGIALCRCGGSNNKPFCDGTHGKNGFTDKKITDGKLDICAHIANCTNNLASVFRLDTEPWIDPNGAEIEEIINTIKKCPSGALSYTVENVEHRDQDREPMVTITKNGPYAVTGDIELLDQPRGKEASTEHYALCRCGGSENKPFCDGTHWKKEFKDEKN